MATLWVSGQGVLLYSPTGGTLGSWVEVPADPGWPLYGEMCWVCGPSSVFKIYVAVEELGVAYWDGTSWHTEYDTGGAGPWPFWRPPDVLSLWCSANDDLVIGSAFGDNNDQIVVRQGSAGSEWFIEYGDGVGTLQPYAVHGTPDGSAVFALVRDWSSDDMLLLQRTAGSPSKTNLLTETGIDATGDNEVHRNVVVTAGADQLQIKVQSVGPPYFRGSVYAKLGAPPTDIDFDYEFYPEGPNLHTLIVPSPAAGTWYVMIKARGYWEPGGGFPPGPPIWHPAEGFNDLSLEINRIAGLGTWAEVARRSAATLYPTWVKLQVVSATNVIIAGIDEVSAGNYTGRIWKWNGTTLSVVFTGSPTYWGYGYAYEDCVGLWVDPSGTQGWACFHGNDVGNAYEKFVRYNGTTWSFFQAVEVAYIIHDVTQLDGGSINTSRATYGYTEYDIFNSKGDGLWPNEYYYGYPPIENYRAAKYPGGPLSVRLTYINADPPSDLDPPYLQNEDPAPLETNVAKDTNIVVEVVDDGFGVDAATVVIQVEGVPAWSGDAQQSGFAVTKTVISGGYRYTINPDSDFAYDQVVDIEVDADDSAVPPNSLNDTYNFTIRSAPALPILDNLNPDDGDTSVWVDVDITGDILGEIVASTIIITVNGVVAWSGEALQNGFSGSVSAIVGGYHFSVHAPSRFAFETLVNVDVYAENTEGDPPADTTYSFTTGTEIIEIAGFGAGHGDQFGLDPQRNVPDVDGPVLANLSPAADEAQVYTDRIINLDVIDLGSDVDPDSVIITVNGTVVWQDREEKSIFAVTEADIVYGYRYTVTPDSGHWPIGSTVTVQVQADDLNTPTPNSATRTYEFETAHGYFVAIKNPAVAIAHFDGQDWTLFYQSPSSAGTAVEVWTNANASVIIVASSSSTPSSVKADVYTGGSWAVHTLPGKTCNSCWGIDGNALFVAGVDNSDNGAVWKWDGAIWTSSFSDSYEVLDVHGISSGEMWAVQGGSSGRARHSVDGGFSWTPYTVKSGANGQVAWVFSATDAVLGFSGPGTTFYRWDGYTFNPMPGASGLSPIGIWGVSPTEIYALSGTSVYKWNGTTWALSFTVPSGLRDYFRLAAATGKDIRTPWENTSGGGLQAKNTRYNGITTYDEDIGPFSCTLPRGIWASDADVLPPALINNSPPPYSSGADHNGVFLVDVIDYDSGVNAASVVIFLNDLLAWQAGAPQPGFSGTATAVPGGYHYDLAPWTPYDFDETIEVEITAEDNDENESITSYYYITDTRVPIYVVGEDPNGNATDGFSYIRRFDGTTWTSFRPSFKGGILRGVWGYNRDNVWVCGDVPPGETAGTLAKWNGSVWTKIVLPTSSDDLQAIWGTTASDVWVCGFGNELWHWNGSAWSDKSGDLPISKDWYGLWSSAADDVFLVGADGTIVHYNGTSWTQQASGTSAYLRTVHGVAPDNVLAAGDGPVCRRYNGSSWQDAATGLGANPRAVWMSGASAAWAACAQGTVYRWNGTLWTISKSVVSGSDTWGIYYRNDNAVWAVGYSGTPQAQIFFWNGSTWALQDDDTAGGGNYAIFGLNPDFEAPVLANQNPAPLDTDVDVDTNIYLELTDVGTGINALSVVLTVNGDTAWTGDAAQPGFAVTKTPIANGYSYSINPTARLSEGVTNTIDVYAEDNVLLPNVLDTSYTFDTINELPYLQNLDPFSGENDVPTDSTIRVEVIDDHSGVDEDTVIIEVEGVVAWSGDAQQPGFTVAKTVLAGGYRYVITPDDLLPENTSVDIHVVADDQAPTPNTLDTTYAFTTINNPPYVDNEDPAPLETDVARTKDVSFDLKDVAGGSGINLSSVRIYLEGSLAYNGATDLFQPPYDGTNSERTAITDGHHFVLDKVVDWDAYDTVVVRVVAEDNSSNAIDVTWNFQVEDYQGPLVEPISPLLGSVNVSVGTNITVEVTDESSINLASLQVEVDRGEGGGFELAFDYDGSPQFKTGWDGPASEVSNVGSTYTIVIDPTTDFAVSTVIKIRVTALDQFGNPARL